MNLLEEITVYQKSLVSRLKSTVALDMLERSIDFQRPVRSLRSILRETPEAAVIAEFKRRSPSNPAINLSARPVEIVEGYQKSGATACSILTNHHYFGGSDQDLVEARAILNI